MSDRINTLPWQPWSLNDLGEQKPAVELPQLPDLELDDPSPDAQAELQQQLATLRLQAEQQGQQLGYADGQQKAMRPVFSPTGGRPPARAAGSATAAAAADRPLAAAGHRIPAHAGRARQRDRFAADAAGTDRRQTGAGPAAGVRRHCPAGADPTADPTGTNVQRQAAAAGAPGRLPARRAAAGVTLSLHGWRLLADGELHPGGCKVSAEEGDLDASLATRWHELCRLAAPGEV